MMNKRILDIVDVLLQHENFITIDQISEVLQVSNKTIRNDLLLVSDWLMDHQLLLIKKTGVGVRIEGNLEEKLHVMESVREKNKAIVNFSPEARKIFIGMQLASYENCRIYELSKQLFVSRATIHKDILSLMQNMERFHITLKRKNNNGISMVGKEKDVRNFLLELMLHDNGYQMFIRFIQHEDINCDGSLVFAGLEVIDDELKDFIDCIVHSNMQYIKSLNFQSLVLLVLRCFIAYLRIKDHQIIHLSAPFLQEMETEPFFQEARALSDRISNHFRFLYPDIEIRYLQIYFLALQNTEDLTSQDQTIANMLSKQLLHSWSEQLALPFEEDQNLYQSVYHHICPAITRFRHGIDNLNPLLDDIHQLYGNTFQIVKHSSICIEEYFHTKLSDDEIGFLALHLAAAMEALKQPLQTVLVCHHGAGASNLAKAKLLAQLPEIRIIRQETFYSVYNTTLDDTDLIITTTALALPTEIPILQINALLHEYDIQRLKEIVKHLYKKKNDPISRKQAKLS